MAGLLDFLGFGGGQQPMQAQMPEQQSRMQRFLDPSVALPLAGALMQPGDFGSNLGQGFALAGQGVATRKKLQQEQAQQNATAKWLEQQGADTGLVELAKSGGGSEALRMFTSMKKRNDLMTVGKNIYDPNTGKWISAPAGMGGDDTEYGLNPIYGEDAQGNTVLGQVSKNGTFKPLSMPQGFKPSTGVDKIDLGTQWGILDKKSGNIIGYQPKDLAGAEAQKAIGDAQGKAAAAAPADAQAAQNALDLLDELRTDPNREIATGKTSILNNLPATGGYDFQTKVEQAKSGAFMTAIQQMRGMGALSNAEGSTATQAVTRMNTATTEQGFLDALDAYEKIVRQGLQRAQSRQGGQQQPVQGIQAPQQAPQGNATSTGVQWRVK